MFKEITGNLITLAKSGQFDVIAHGCNCHCSMGGGIAPQMAQEFGADTFPLELHPFRGDINKLGQIEWRWIDLFTGDHKNKKDSTHTLAVVNCYSQYGFGKNHSNGVTIPLDYEALTLCLRKINHEFKGMRVGIPLIGCGLAGGIWDITKLTDEEIRDIEFDLNDFIDVKKIVQRELEDCDVTVVHFDQPTNSPFKI